jgi:uncharacterized protein YegL
MRKKNWKRRAGLACAAVLTAAALAGILPAAGPVPAVHAEGTEDPLQLTKNVSDNGDGTWTIQCEAFTTGTVITQTRRIPADIVLVLDYSGSMTWAYDGSSSRLAALQSAVGNFIDNVKEHNADLTDTSLIDRIAVVKFDDSSTVVQGLTPMTAEQAASLKATVNALPAGTVTRTDMGMESAGEILKSQGTEGHTKTVILFTDGGPNGTVNGVNTGYHVSVGNRALAASRTMKESGTEVYTVCIDPHANSEVETELPSYEKLPGDIPGVEFGYDSPNIKGGGATPNTTDSNMIHLINRFMNLISGNNPHASDIDTPNAEDPADKGSTGSSEQNYCLTPHSAAALDSVFRQISEKIESQDLALGKNAELRDYVKAPFVLCDDPQIRTYISARKAGGDGTFSWGSPEEATGLQAAADPENQCVTVSGFDYNASFVCDTGHAEDPSNYGRKLIVTFRIRAAGTFGGNGIPTNGDASGIYPDGDGTAEAVGLFPVPSADIPIRFDIVSSDAAVYVPDPADISRLVTAAEPDGTVSCFKEGFLPDGITNAYVDLSYELTDPAGVVRGTMTVPAGTAAGQGWNWTAGTADGQPGLWKVICTVTPTAEGKQPAVTISAAPELSVFHPLVTLQDTEKAVGEEADFIPDAETDAIPSHLTGIRWISGDGTESETSREPALRYVVTSLRGLSLEDGKYVVRGQDFVPAAVRVIRTDGENRQDITDRTDFAHVCSRTDCDFTAAAAKEGADFVIHVRKPQDSPAVPGGNTGTAEPEIVKTAENTSVNVTCGAENAVVQPEPLAGAAPVPVPQTAALPTVGSAEPDIPATGNVEGGVFFPALGISAGVLLLLMLWKKV